MIKDINEAKEIIKTYSGNETKIEDLLIEMAESKVYISKYALFDWAIKNMDISEIITKIMDTQLNENMEKLNKAFELLKRGNHFEENEVLKRENNKKEVERMKNIKIIKEAEVIGLNDFVQKFKLKKEFRKLTGHDYFEELEKYDSEYIDELISCLNTKDKFYTAIYIEGYKDEDRFLICSAQVIE